MIVLVGVVLLLVAACTSSEPEPGPADGDLVGHLEGNEEWESIHRQMKEQAAASFLEWFGEPPPDDARFVRFIEAGEYASVRVSCLAQQGFPEVVAMRDGGVDYRAVSPDQAQAMEEAAYRCAVAYPVHPTYFTPHTEELIRVVYDYRVGELLGCLAREGYVVDDPPPSWDTFLADYRAEDRHPWSPYDFFVVGTEDEWQRLNEVCPQNPPDERLFGG
jgi:hypothetical protein